MAGIDSDVLAIMPAAFAFRMRASAYQNLLPPPIIRPHHARLGSDDYQPKIIAQRIEQQKIFSAGANLYRSGKRRTNLSKGA